MEKSRKSSPIIEEKKVIHTQYISIRFHVDQVINNYIYGSIVPTGGYDFNKAYIYSQIGFCSTNDAYSLHDKLDFHKFQEVLNFVNKKWGWKVLTIVPIIETEKTGYGTSSWDNSKTGGFLYTFYREIEE